MNTHFDDPDFIGSVAFYYCHDKQQEQARELLNRMLEQYPHNAWLQHVYAHTLDDDKSEERDMGINFLRERIADWPAQKPLFLKGIIGCIYMACFLSQAMQTHYLLTLSSRTFGVMPSHFCLSKTMLL